MDYTRKYVSRLINHNKKIEIVLRDLVDAVKSSGAAEAVVSNDLGNALEAAENILEDK